MDIRTAFPRSGDTFGTCHDHGGVDVPSAALARWAGDRRAEIERARTAARLAPRRTPDEQATADLALASYLRVCCSEFQAFCADLFDDALEQLRRYLKSAAPNGTPRVGDAMTDLLLTTLGAQRRLSSGNPTLNNLASDFDRLGVSLRGDALVRSGPATGADLQALDKELLVTRNQIMHGEARMGSVAVGLPPRRIGESQIDRWRASLGRIAITLDRVVASDLTTPLGSRPW